MDGEDVERFEAISTGSSEQPARLVGGESMYLLRSRSRRLHRVGYVSLNEVPLRGLREATAQDVVHLVDRRGTEFRV
ncbi:MAG TPA: hypothetical protein VE194_11905 [Rubrobacter sp.]|nr:hypothetical protein [Rubrobacter sp.]